MPDVTASLEVESEFVMLTTFRCCLVNVARILVLASLTMAAVSSTAADPSDALRDSALRGDAKAQFELGNTYQFKDDAEAASWWRKAAEQDHAEAQLALAFAYLLGSGVPKDQAAGVAWFRKAAEQGVVAAQFSLGLAYELGRIVPHDIFFAVYWYRKAADGGHAQAIERLGRFPEQAAVLGDAERLFYLGVSYMPSLDLEANPEATIRGADGSPESATWWREAAEMGHVNAQFLLAQYLFANDEPDEALAWVRKAADQGYADAQFLMSHTPDLTDRAAWLRKAAEQGHAKAQCRLGIAYILGQGVPRDRVKSYAWINLSSMGGTTPDDECHDLLDGAEEILTSEEVAEAQTLSRELYSRIERLTGNP